MSFLLDALRKSEQQRRLGETPSIQVPIIGQTNSTRASTSKLWLAFVVVVLLLLLWLFFLQSSSTDNESLLSTEPVEQNVATGQQPSAPVEQNSEVSSEQQRIAAAEQQLIADTEQLLREAGADELIDQVDIEQAVVSTAPTVINGANSDATERQSKPMQVDQVNNNNDQLPSALNEQNEEQVATDFNALAEQIAKRELNGREANNQIQAVPSTGAPIERAQAVNQQTDPISSDQPLPVDNQQAIDGEDDWQPQRPSYISFFELPTNIRQALPDLSISIRVYDDAPEKRFVIINRIRLQEGDVVPETDEVKLVEIKRQSLILAFEDYVFEYQ